MSTNHIRYFLIFAVALLLFPQLSHATYTVTNINTTVILNKNSSAQVVDILRVSIDNISVGQYSQNRLALNLTLSQWQSIVGTQLTEHILNPTKGAYDFNFLPGPLQSGFNGRFAYLSIKYSVPNVTTVTQTAPRTFQYSFNNKVFNFQTTSSGPALGANTSLTIILPSGSRVISVYPLPDYPAYGFAQNYRNATTLQWFQSEPLSQFTLAYTVQQSLQSEVLAFFAQVYNFFGWFLFALIAAAVIIFLYYTYHKAEMKEQGRKKRQ